jgi:integrase
VKRRRFPKGVSEYRDNRGTWRTRFRRKGFKTYSFKAKPFTPEWEAELRACLEGRPDDKIQPGADRVIPGTIEALIVAYFKSTRWQRKSEASKANCRSIINRVREAIGKAAVRDFRARHADAFLAKLADRPGAFNNMRKQLKAVWAWGMAVEMAAGNPWAATEKMKAGPGFHTWTEEEIDAFKARWGPGTKERLALLLMLNTCQRRGDAIRLAPQHIQGGRLRFWQGKTGKFMSLPIIDELADELARHAARGEALLLTEYGKPFTPAGFGNWFADRCRAAGVPGRAHGLRKAAARRLSDAGATQQEIKAWGGWSNDAEVALYVAGADRARLADQSASKMASSQPALANSSLNLLEEKAECERMVTPTGVEQSNPSNQLLGRAAKKSD